ncbi:MAG: type II toxin-antitoxin system VapC family toxin [Ginsengibacter sp.]
MDYLLDTNFVINYFKGIFERSARQFTDSIINRTTYISVITRIELLGWKLIVNKDEKVIKEFISDSIVLSLEESIIIRTISLRKTFRIKRHDSIIAATALANNLQLLTHNIKDFKNVSGLEVVDANAL